MGAILMDGAGKTVKELSVYLGEATNNVAEYCALILALQEALCLGCRQAEVFTDSELLARQVSGQYRVRDKRLQWLHALIQHLVQSFDRFELRHFPREENRRADRLANRAVTDYLKRHPVSSVPKPPVPAPDLRQASLF